VLNAQEVGEFCRRRGLYPEQWAAWREACLVANTPPPRREEPAECRALRRRNSELEGEWRRKEKALAEAATLLVLQKKVRVLLGARGRKLDLGERQTVIALIREAGAAGARLAAACAVLDVSPRTGQRWQAEGGVKVDGRHAAAQARTPANALSPAERHTSWGSPTAPSLPASHRARSYPTGRPGRVSGLGSHVLPGPARADQRATAARPRRPATIARRLGSPPPQSALELGYHLPGLRRGRAVFLPLPHPGWFSRKIVGWEIHPETDQRPRCRPVRQAHLREGVAANTWSCTPTTAPDERATLLVTLQRLGVVPSFSRPAVSNDNPYSEALFKTCKDRPASPNSPSRAWNRPGPGWPVSSLVQRRAPAQAASAS